jgi:hypothetical protein
MSTKISTRKHFELGVPADSYPKIHAAQLAYDQELVAYLPEVSMDERVTFSRVGPKMIEFVNKVLAFMRAHPELVPPSIDIEELAADVAAINQLREWLQPLQRVVYRAEGCLRLCLHQASVTCRAYYAVNKTNAKIGQPDAAMVDKALSPYFQQKRRAASPDVDGEAESPEFEDVLIED